MMVLHGYAILVPTRGARVISIDSLLVDLIVAVHVLHAIAVC